MVVRPSSSSWSLCPEKIMSHHFRLTSGIRPVVDTSPPYSMYNSPISIHYIPKRASSADAAKRNTLQRPHRELSAFINSNTPNLRLPLPLRSSRNELVKPKLLGNRNYNPPVRRTPIQHKPPLPVPEPQPHFVAHREHPVENPRRRERSRRSQAWIAFKDCVYSFVIQRGVFTDGIIIDTVESEMEKWEDQLSWSQLETLRDEIYDELGVRREEVVRVSKGKQKRRGSSVGSSSASSASSSSSTSSSSEKSRKSSASSSTSSSSSKTSRSQSEESSSSSESSRSQSSNSSLSTRTSSSSR